MFALCSEKSWLEFKQRDDKARSAKRSILRFGIASVLLGLLALVLATLDIAYLAPALEIAKQCADCDSRLLSLMSREGLEKLTKFVAAGAALAGVVSFITGYWQGGFGSRKRRWLQLRMCCELIRQWRWAYFLGNLDKISAAAGVESLEREYTIAQEQALDAYLRDLDADLQLRFASAVAHGSVDPTEDIISSDKPDLTNLLDDPAKARTLEIALEAYDAVRLRGQVRYATYITEETGPFETHPARQHAVLHWLEDVLVVVVLVAHLLVVLGALAGIPAFKDVLVHLVAITSALAALAAGAVSRGLRPEAHLSRLRGYRSEVQAIRTRFRKAGAANEKVAAAYDLERAAFDEMIDFVQEANAAKFVM